MTLTHQHASYTAWLCMANLCCFTAWLCKADICCFTVSAVHACLRKTTVAYSLLCAAGKPAEVIAAFDKIKEQLGHPEVLIYNAGPGGVTFPPPSKTSLNLLS